MKNTKMKSIKIDIQSEDKLSVTVTNCSPELVIEVLKKLHDNMVRDQRDIEDAISACKDDDEVVVEKDEDEKDFEEFSKFDSEFEFPDVDEAYAAFERGKSTTTKAMKAHDVPCGTMPDSVGKILSILGQDEQIKNDLAKLVSGFIINEEYMLASTKESKKKKKK